LQEKLASLEKKIIVGGENLLEKAELQARLLAESEKELEARLQKETELKKRLVEREVGHSILRKSKFLCFILDFFIFFI
jgi:kinesin family protein 3/17